MSWPLRQITENDSAALPGLVQQILAGEIAGLRMPAFGSTAQCASLAELTLHAQGRLEHYADANVQAAHLGPPAIKYSGTPAAYFAAAADWNRWQDEALATAWNAPAQLAELIARAFPGFACSVASDPQAGRYFHGIIREIARSPLHNDCARRDLSQWVIGRCEQQLAWNVYLTQSAEGGGETTIFRRPWRHADEHFKRRDAMGYDHGVVVGAVSTRYAPMRGELMVFNCVNYHEVMWTHGSASRLTIGGFIGISSADRSVMLWS